MQQIADFGAWPKESHKILCLEGKRFFAEGRRTGNSEENERKKSNFGGIFIEFGDDMGYNGRALKIAVLSFGVSHIWKEIGYETCSWEPITTQ